MRRFFLFACIVILAIANSGCSLSRGMLRLLATLPSQEGMTVGSGQSIKALREIRNVSSVALTTIGTLQITLGEHERLVIEGDENIIPHIVTIVQDGRLMIASDGTGLRPKAPLIYYLTLRELKDVSNSSAGKVIASQIETDTFRAALTSAGDMEIESLSAPQIELRLSSAGNMRIGTITCDSLRVTISSSGNLRIAGGTANEQDITLSSSGNYEAGGVLSRTVRARLSSSGDATVRASEKLEAILSSSGNLRYYGRPTISERRTSAGRLIPMED